MFEIPDDDDSFWNDIPLEGSIPLKSGHMGKENKPQLRFPDTICTGNPAKRLCTDFIRGGTSSVQTENPVPQLRGINNVTSTKQRRENSTIYTESPFHVPFPSTDLDNSLSVDTGKELNPSKSGSGCKEIFSRPGASEASVSTVESLDSERTGHKNLLDSNSGNRMASLTSKNMETELGNKSADKKNSIKSNSSDKNMSERNDVQAERNEISIPDLDTAKVKPVQSNSKELFGVSGSVNRSGVARFSMGDHVTPKRKRKFPGPAGILPKLGPGTSLDMLSPAALNASPNVTENSVQDDSMILCSQSTEDIFSDAPWQALLRDMGEDGQKLLKKFSVSSTLLKAGKKQLIQGKAALIFGVIDTIESHGSEASVTIRDKSGRMQGTIHHDLFKDHEAELQAGTVLVLKQVSIISLSNKNHYLNITPNNVVALYCGGQSSLRTLKFHGSQESLHSVLSALEKKAAAHRENLNNSVTMTPSSLTGSSRQPLTTLGTGTPQLFSPYSGTPGQNQQLFSPRASVTGHPASLRTPVPASVRDVSVVQANNVPSYPRFRNSTQVPDFRHGTNTSAVKNNTSPQLTSGSAILSTPNTNFKVVSVQNSSDFSRFNSATNKQSINSNLTLNTCSGILAAGSNVDNNTSFRMGVQQQIISNQPAISTSNSGGKSKWKFKSPPGRSGSIHTSPDLSSVTRNQGSSKLENIHEIKKNMPSTAGHIDVSNSGNVHSGSSVHSSANMTSSKNTGYANRSWQLNNQNSAKKTGNGVNVTSYSGKTTSAWSFKTSTLQNKDTGTEKHTGLPSKIGNQSVEDLWEDDLSDDILSQLSEELT